MGRCYSVIVVPIQITLTNTFMEEIADQNVTILSYQLILLKLKLN